jgi:hypothetical protein
MISRLIPILLLTALPLAAQEEESELTPYSVSEVESFLNSFKSTYNKRGTPEEDAISVLADLRKAYLYLDSKGDKASKEEVDAKEDIVKMISRGLKARNRPLLTVECVRALEKIRDPESGRDVTKWLTKVLDEKAPNPQFVEYGFLALAHIGPQDNRALDLVLKYGTTGRHTDMTVASHALKAAYEYRALEGKDRKELFKKINGYLLGLYSNWKGGDVKKRASFETKYKAVSETGLRALSELSGSGKKFASPVEADEWWGENKRSRWTDYVGPEFRKPEEKKDEEKKTEEKDTEG